MEGKKSCDIVDCYISKFYFLFLNQPQLAL